MQVRSQYFDKLQFTHVSSRKSLDYGNYMLNRNLKRVAEVWMDDYKEYFYQALPYARPIRIGR
jgi:hypothetical protein